MAWFQCYQFTPQRALYFPRAADYFQKFLVLGENEVNADFTAEEVAFQEEVREFLKKEFPADLKAKVDASIRLDKDDMVRWQKILFKQGWAAPTWPVEHGGTGWSHTKTHIFATEMGL
ncbi:MAG: acyl-CoA dehydrogenase family protein, partial [Pseudomonadota bacterium]|nr:acyl-CoA dehydrogenase family protein [Pseudomonadota bacterium]